MKITINKEYAWGINHNVTIDTNRRDKEQYQPGAMIASVAPWSTSGCPLTLEIAICPDGTILHRGWSWCNNANAYLHTHANAHDVTVTQAMAETLAGLWSGRLKIDGIKIAVGASCQRICPINLTDEETKSGHAIYLA